MTRPTREEALAHFGVKGMKWGVRRSSGSGPSSARPVVKKSTRGMTFKKHAITAGLVASYVAIALAEGAAVRGVGSISTTPQATSGKKAISNPKIMQAKSKRGVFKITTL